MARKVRMQHPGAVYCLIDRGDVRDAVFEVVLQMGPGAPGVVTSTARQSLARSTDWSMAGGNMAISLTEAFT